MLPALYKIIENRGNTISQINNIKLCSWVIPLVMLVGLPCMAGQFDADTNNDQSSIIASSQAQNAGNQEKKNRRSRLKYRNGSVCMCNEGMSEADIQAAIEKQRAQQ